MNERPSLSYPVMLAEEWPHGLGCVECHRQIPPGAPYAEKVEGFYQGEFHGEHNPLDVRIVCVYCAVREPSEAMPAPEIEEGK